MGGEGEGWEVEGEEGEGDFDSITWHRVVDTLTTDGGERGRRGEGRREGQGGGEIGEFESVTWRRVLDTNNRWEWRRRGGGARVRGKG